MRTLTALTALVALTLAACGGGGGGTGTITPPVTQMGTLIVRNLGTCIYKCVEARNTTGYWEAECGTVSSDYLYPGGTSTAPILPGVYYFKFWNQTTGCFVEFFNIVITPGVVYTLTITL